MNDTYHTDEMKDGLMHFLEGYMEICPVTSGEEWNEWVRDGIRSFNDFYAFNPDQYLIDYAIWLNRPKPMKIAVPSATVEIDYDGTIEAYQKSHLVPRDALVGLPNKRYCHIEEEASEETQMIAQDLIDMSSCNPVMNLRLIL